MANTLLDIKKYLDCELKELKEVWETMSETEREEWKNTDLTS